MTGKDPVWAEIDLDAINHNVASLKSHVGDETSVLGVVKANAYGHGDVAIAPAVVAGGAEWLGVARVSEGEELRASGIEAPILLLSEPPKVSIPKALAAGLTPTVYTADGIATIDAAATARVGVHLKVDTGMHRYGASPEAATALVGLIDSSDNLELAGIWSHLAVAEETANPFTKQQFERFMDVVDALGTRANSLIKHISNSAATLNFKPGHLDMVRCGISIYGIPPSRELSAEVDLRPALALKSQVGAVQRLKAGEAISYGLRYTLRSDANIATIQAGYADGLTRALTGKSEVLVGGKRFTISGSITMDHFMVDAGADQLKSGDEVVIIGSQGSETVSAHDVADALGTIPYEVVCAIGARVPRVYLNASSVGPAAPKTDG